MVLKKPDGLPALASQSHQINSRVGMSGDDKAQFSLTFGAFKPKPGNRKWAAHPLQVYLLPAFTVAVKLLEGATIEHLPIAAHPHYRSPGPLLDCLEKLDGTKFRIRLHHHHPALTQLGGHCCQQLARQLHGSWIAFAPPYPKAPGYSPLSNHQIQHLPCAIPACRPCILTQGSGASGSLVGVLNCKNSPHFSKLVRSINTRTGVVG